MARWKYCSGDWIDVTLSTGGRTLSSLDDWVEEAIDWIAHTDRPGRFTYEWGNDFTTVIFYISDPDVALEFKMRFG